MKAVCDNVSIQWNRRTEKLDEFVNKNIQRVECTRYVDANKNGLCYCGRYKNEHKTSLLKTGDGPYNAHEDLTFRPTNAYGEMKLSGFRSIAGQTPKYIRAADNEKLLENMYKIITEYWNIPKPELIISLNGGAKKMLPLSSHAKLAFKTGIIKLAKNAPTWIITGGFGFGVSKLVGEANYDYLISSPEKQFYVIGIGTWGAVTNREELTLKEKRQVTYSNVKGSTVGKGQAPLDPHHDIFLLYDGERQREFGLEISFRSNFEQYAANKASCSVVQVVVEGGKKSIITASEALNSHIPLVVMKGSKRAADVICDVIETPNETMAEEVINSLMEEYEDEWGIRDQRNELSGALKSMREFARDDMVKIFNMSDFGKNLDKAILEAAFSAKDVEGKNIDTISKLKLSMIYNRPDIAEEVIFEKGQMNLLNHKEQIKSALHKNQWKFIELFLNHGLTVESFLTIDLLLELYNIKKMSSELSSNVLHIYKHLLGDEDDAIVGKEKKLARVSKIIQNLTNNLISHKYEDFTTDKSCSCRDSDIQEYCYPNEVNDFDKELEKFDVTKVKKHKKGWCILCGGEEYTKHYEYTRYPPVNDKDEIIFTEQDLFFWALITQRMEMARVFWENGKDHIGSALVASVICKNLADIARKEGEVEMMNNLLNHKKEFEDMATNILTEAYWRDKIRTHLLLIRALPYIDRTSCMEIADKNQMVDFLFHSACQTRLNSIWLGGMSPYLSTFKIILNLPFGFITTKLLLYPSSNSKAKLKATTDEIDNIQTDELREAMVEKNKADNIKDPKVRKEYLTKFRNRQQESWKNVSFCKAVNTYYRAPITKFLMNLLSYIVFLCLFTYYTLVELKPLKDVNNYQERMFEFMVYIYVATYVIEEIRQFAGTPAMSFTSRIIEWISSLWNIFDVLLYVMFIIAVILRHITSVDFVYARTIFSLTLSMYCFRFLQFYYAHQSLGPKVIMISRMMKDIGFFLAIYVIAVFAYGTFAQALLFPNSQLNPLLLKHIVYLPYWQTYGELELNYVEGDIAQGTKKPEDNAMVVVAFALFMLFSNVLLLNLLIAMFGNTFAKVEENSNRIWAYNRYHLIEEFYYRPILPPPINIFEIIYNLFQSCTCSRGPQKKPVDQFLVNLCHDEDLQSSGFEQQCMETYLIDHPFTEEDESANAKEKSAMASSMSALPDAKPEPKLTSQASKDVGEETIKRMLSKLDDIKSQITDMNEKVRKVRRHQKKTNQTGATPGTNKKLPAYSIDDDDDEDGYDGVRVMSKRM